jgi:nicotinate-nucleotide adenylyltransferase
MIETQLVLFGLNADPPHLGHRQVIHEVEKALGQGATFIAMPTGEHPFQKKQHASSHDRLMMTKILFQGLKQVKVDDYEIKKKDSSYTIDTLIYLKSHYPKTRLYFIMATDAANSFFNWRDAERICQLATPILVSRVGFELDEKVKDKLLKLCHPLILKTNSLNVSSTDIRRQLQIGGDVKDVPKEVLDYIKEHHLYRS